MVEMEDAKAFESFRVLQGDANVAERDLLFRNMAQLFSYVSDRCNDEQVAQYDDVLCRLAELVETEARAHVASILAPLDRAPGTVVVKLARDHIDVARPLLEFSAVLSDDDLIEIVNDQSEDHRVAIAGRERVGERVGEAIVDKGGRESVTRLVRNHSAAFGTETLGKLARRAADDNELETDLRGRDDVDWNRLQAEIADAGDKVLEQLTFGEKQAENHALGAVSAVVYNRLRNRAGFNASEWKLSWNQVKALSDRRQLNQRALARFVRFGYGHHTAAALTMLLKTSPEVFVKWLASQDYVAMTVACKAIEIDAEMFAGVIGILPWRNMPSDEDIENARQRFESLGTEEAHGIFDLWRAHSFRNRSEPEKAAGAA
jgi:hypothetical protein